MKPVSLLFVLVLPCGIACHREPPPAPAAENADSGAIPHAPQPAAARELRIDPEMLRDLRMTQAAVEERPAGDGATMIGELHVNGDAYAEVGSPIAARVRALWAAPGQQVEAGQALIGMESAELGRARAELLGATARLDLATQALERKKSLAGGPSVVAGRELQEAEAELHAAAAAADAARATLDALGSPQLEAEPAGGGNAAAFTLRAPIAGTVLAREAVLGRRVGATQVLFRIADLSRLWLVVHAFERDAVRVRRGARARLVLAALPGRSFSGEVTWIGSEVDPVSRTVPVRVELENSEGELRPGMSATAWVPLGEEGSTVRVVPAAALQRVSNDWCVFLPAGAGVFERRAVGRGRDLGDEVEILSGLEPGEQVVVEGAFLLKVEAEKAAGRLGEGD